MKGNFFRMSETINNVKNETKTVKYRRAGLMDEIRGFCILCMVFYHVGFDLYYNYEVKIPLMFDDWFEIVVQIFAGMFIFISGMSCRYSRNNAKRGIQCFFIGMCVTFVFAFIAPTAPVYFGILHCLGVCMMFYAIGEQQILKIPVKVAIPVLVVLFVMTRGLIYGYLGPANGVGIRLPDFLYNAKLLFPLGFAAPGFTSMDYFPLMPWLFVFLAGAYIGGYAVNDKMPEFFYKTHCKPLAFIGKNTLWVYVLHQPIAIIILFLIFGRF